MAWQISRGGLPARRHQNLVYYNSVFLTVGIHRVPGAENHNFNYKDGGYSCIDCGAKVTDGQLAATGAYDSLPDCEDKLAALGLSIGDCVTARLRQNIRRILLDKEIKDFHVYLHNTSRSALSWALF